MGVVEPQFGTVPAVQRDGDGLIVQLLADLVRARSDTIDGLINRAVAELGQFAKANRCYVFEFCDEGRMCNTHEWVGPGTSAEIDNLQDLPIELLDPCIDDFRRDVPLHVGDVAGWDEGGPLRETLLAQGIKAILLVPFWTEDGVLGFIGFDNTRQAVPFDASVVSLLCAAADVIGTTLHRLGVKAESERARSETEQSHQRLTGIFNAIPDFLFELDQDGKYTGLAVCPPEKMLVPMEERTGRHFRDVMPPQVVDYIAAGFATAQTGRTSDPVRYPLVQNGETAWYEMVVAPVGDPASPNFRSLIIARDVTRDEKSRQALEKTGLVAKLMTNLVILTDVNANVLWANPAFQKKSGFSIWEMLGRPLLDFTRTPKSDPAVCSEIAEAMAARRPFSGEILNATRSGEEYWVDLNITFDSESNGGQGTFVHVATDITKQKQTQDELAHYQSLLESALDALPDAFAYFDATDALVICNERYRDFYPRTAEVIKPGIKFEELIRFGVERGEYVGAIGREEEWIADRMEQHRVPGEPLEQQLSDGRWLQILERPTEDGGRVGMRVDITAIKHAEERLAGIIEGASVGTWEWVRGVDELRVNERYARMFDYEHGEIDRQPVTKVIGMIHEVDRDRIAASMTGLLWGADDKIADEFRAYRRDGSVVWLEARGRVVSRCTNGHPRRVSGVLMDITERKSSELALKSLNEELTKALEQRDEAERRFRDIANLSTDWFFETDKDLNHTYLSENFFKLMGVAADDLVGRPLGDIRDLSCPAAQDGAAWPELETALEEQEKIGSFFFEGRAADGATRWLRFAMTPLRLPDGALSGYRGVGTDVTELYNERMKALQASEAKSRFLANMSHEIRTPLNGVLGMAELLAPTLTDDHQRSMIATVQSSGELLLSLLNNILDMSKIEAGQLKLAASPVMLSELAEEARDVYSELARNKGIRFSLDRGDGLSMPRSGDVNRLRQILHNLLNNAIKFTSEGAIDFFISAPLGEAVCIEVRDTGIGMTKEQVAVVFESFRQADVTTSGKFGGSGLGLAVVRELVDLMGGRVEVDSRLGEGTVFRVSLPLPEAPVQIAAPDTTRLDRHADISSRLKGRRVLVVDDSPTNLLVLCNMLAGTGCHITEAMNGSDAVAAFDKALRGKDGAPFDLVLLDIAMPEMDGVQAIARMREMEESAGVNRTPIISVTANAMAHQVADYIVAGFDSFLSKPFRQAELQNVIAPFLDCPAGGASNDD